MFTAAVGATAGLPFEPCQPEAKATFTATLRPADLAQVRKLGRHDFGCIAAVVCQIGRPT